MAELRKRGVHAALVCSTPFEQLARNQARILGVPGLDLIVVDHPVAGVSAPVVRQRASQAAGQVCAILRHFA